MIDLERLAIANQILNLLVADRSRFSTTGQQLYFHWQTQTGEEIQRQWKTTNKQDSWPIFWRQWAHGGTHCNALCQLARWIQGRAVFPRSVWVNWLGDSVKIGLEGKRAAIGLLIDAYWPRSVDCIKCNKLIDGQFDWFGHGARSGCAHVRCCNA